MRYTLTSVFFTQGVLAVLLALMLFPQTGLIYEIIWILCASLLLFYLPGYRIGYLFFSEHDLSAFERFILNFLVSLTLVILVSYYLYFTSSSLSMMKIYLISIVILLFSIAAVLIRWRGGVDEYEESDG